MVALSIAPVPSVAGILLMRINLSQVLRLTRLSAQWNSVDEDSCVTLNLSQVFNSQDRRGPD